MSTVRYPHVKVQLLGEDGNAFNLIGITAKAIKRQVGREEGDAFVVEAMNQESYDALLAFIQNTVVVE